MNEDGLGKTYGDREVIVRQGDLGECMYAIQAGCVEVVREAGETPVRLAVLNEGEIFGEMAIFDQEHRSATVRALGAARVLTIDKKTLFKRLHEDPSIALKVVQALCTRVRRMNVELEKLVRVHRRRTARPALAMEGKQPALAGNIEAFVAGAPRNVVG